MFPAVQVVANISVVSCPISLARGMSFHVGNMIIEKRLAGVKLISDPSSLRFFADRPNIARRKVMDS